MAEIQWFRASVGDAIEGKIFIDDATNKVTRAPYRNETPDTPCEFVVYYPDGRIEKYPLNANTTREFLPVPGQEPSVVGCSVAFHAYQT